MTTAGFHSNKVYGDQHYHYCTHTTWTQKILLIILETMDLFRIEYSVQLTVQYILHTAYYLNITW